MAEYKDVLQRHGQNTTVRRMHRQIGGSRVWVLNV
jgi:hypothetical protein